MLVEIERPRAENQTTEDLARLHGLTRAESAVLSCMMEGLRNGEAAARLHVSIETVRTHVRRVLDKLGARSRTEAVVLASRPQKAREVYSRSGASRRQVE